MKTLKTPILVSKIRANTVGCVTVVLRHARHEHDWSVPVATLLIPVTDASRDDINPTTTRYQYGYTLHGRIRKVIEKLNLPDLNHYGLSFNNHIIPVDKLPAYHEI